MKIYKDNMSTFSTFFTKSNMDSQIQPLVLFRFLTADLILKKELSNHPYLKPHLA